jgi:uracil-DNA glycosylase
MDIDKASNDINPSQALHWLVEMGADEIISETAFDRFAASLVVEQPRLAQVQVAPAVRSATLPDQSAYDAEQQAMACSTVEALIQAQNYFDANPLRKSATQLSFIEGNFSSPIMIIGDRPRNEEDRSGQVFAGKARVLLSAMLAAINIKIENVLMMNFVPWRPPGNRAPTENEIALCLPFARRAIELIQPKLILSLGSTAAQHLAGGDVSIARQRGKWLNVANGLLLATHHPEELLKFPLQKKLAWRDVLAFKMKWDELA